MCWCCR